MAGPAPEQEKERYVIKIQNKYSFSYACPPFFLSAVIMADWRAWPHLMEVQNMFRLKLFLYS